MQGEYNLRERRLLMNRHQGCGCGNRHGGGHSNGGNGHGSCGCGGHGHGGRHGSDCGCGGKGGVQRGCGCEQAADVLPEDTGGEHKGENDG
jgi:hypothetical protein